MEKHKENNFVKKVKHLFISFALGVLLVITLNSCNKVPLFHLTQVGFGFGVFPAPHIKPISELEIK